MLKVRLVPTHKQTIKNLFESYFDILETEEYNLIQYTI